MMQQLSGYTNLYGGQLIQHIPPPFIPDFNTVHRNQIYSHNVPDFIPGFNLGHPQNSYIGQPFMSNVHYRPDLNPQQGAFLPQQIMNNTLLQPSTPTFDYLPWQITHSF